MVPPEFILGVATHISIPPLKKSAPIEDQGLIFGVSKRRLL
jgi:hypothetical protein